MQMATKYFMNPGGCIICLAISITLFFIGSEYKARYDTENWHFYNKLEEMRWDIKLINDKLSDTPGALPKLPKSIAGIEDVSALLTLDFDFRLAEDKIQSILDAPIMSVIPVYRFLRISANKELSPKHANALDEIAKIVNESRIRESRTLVDLNEFDKFNMNLDKQFVKTHTQLIDTSAERIAKAKIDAERKMRNEISVFIRNVLEYNEAKEKISINNRRKAIRKQYEYIIRNSNELQKPIGTLRFISLMAYCFSFISCIPSVYFVFSVSRKKIINIKNSTQACPLCGEKIKAEAIVCKHCGRNLPYA